MLSCHAMQVLATRLSFIHVLASAVNSVYVSYVFMNFVLSVDSYVSSPVMFSTQTLYS